MQDACTHRLLCYGLPTTAFACRLRKWLGSIVLHPSRVSCRPCEPAQGMLLTCTTLPQMGIPSWSSCRSMARRRSGLSRDRGMNPRRPCTDTTTPPRFNDWMLPFHVSLWACRIHHTAPVGSADRLQLPCGRGRCYGSSANRQKEVAHLHPLFMRPLPPYVCSMVWHDRREI